MTQREIALLAAVISWHGVTAAFCEESVLETAEAFENWLLAGDQPKPPF